MNVLNLSDVFMSNRDKLCILPGLAEIVYDKVEKNEILEVATIH